MSEFDLNSTDEIERQLARANYYSQTVQTKLSERINLGESYLFGMLDLMMEKGLLTQEELDAKVADIQEDINKRAAQYGNGVALYNDKSEIVIPEINCEERLHICKAACCRLQFPLTITEVEEGKVRWDYARPYNIRHTPNGRCVHLDQGSCHCGLYDNRPRVCRTYSCEGDKRIWTDFENMVLNEEWLEKHCSGEKVVFRAKSKPAPPMQE